MAETGEWEGEPVVKCRKFRRPMGVRDFQSVRDDGNQ